MIKIQGNTLVAGKLELDFPAVRISLNNKVYTPELPGKVTGRLEREYICGPVTLKVKVEKFSRNVFRKKVTLIANTQLPTPDWVESDRQSVKDPSLSRRGYQATAQVSGRPGAEEAGGTIKPGCGYPLIGKNFFTGIEHPAAFAVVESADNNYATYALTQHPVWSKDNTIEAANVVFSYSDDAENAFYDYLDAIRIPPRTKPMVSLCSFWSDPYLGNYEYLIAPENYRSFVDAFHKLGIVPDVYTLDAGWQNRQSIFEPKSSFGGQPGMDKLDKHIRKRGSRLGLWVSHNGPMGIAPDYLKKHNFAVGSGESSTYCGDGYGVLLDEKYEKAIGDKFVELAKSGVMHLKMDWDNDCASNASFSEIYPTRDHVREGSINAIIRIAQRIRQTNPDLVMRYGWWPSPWHLQYNHHFFLSDSGDSEYSSLPSRSQRDSAATHRDTMYYCHFNRDRSAFPLDAIDNHDFPHALRNPMHEEPGIVANIAMLAVMRGCSYLPLKLQPEALEDYFVEILRNTLQFIRIYGHKLYTARSGMFGGNPSAGAVYGYKYEQSDGSAIAVLRNPSAMPQEYCWQEKRSGVWVYPYFAKYTAGTPVIFAPHEVKVIFLDRKKLSLPFKDPFQATKLPDGNVEFRFPAHAVINKKIGPMVGEIYRINKIESEWISFKRDTDGLKCLFRLRLPYRMRNTTLNVQISGGEPDKIDLRARVSRYAVDFSSCCNLPVTRFSASVPGGGEVKNPDTVLPVHDAAFAVPLAEGGEAFYSLFLKGATDPGQIKLSISGVYATSREAEIMPWQPQYLDQTLAIPQYPDGFPMAQFIDLPENLEELLAAD